MSEGHGKTVPRPRLSRLDSSARRASDSAGALQRFNSSKRTVKRAAAPASAVVGGAAATSNTAPIGDGAIDPLDAVLQTLTSADPDSPNFVAHGRQFRFSSRSLGCLSATNPLRKRLVWLITSKAFENVILALIVLNSVSLGMVDFANVDPVTYQPVTEGSWRNQFASVAETVFLGLFTVELVLKVAAMGFVLDKGCYLRDAWNWLDFTVVAGGLLNYVPGVPSVGMLRTLRVLRPLRGIVAVPRLRMQVASLLNSMPRLFNLFILAFFFFAIYGILGLQLWQGVLERRCRLTPLPVLLPPGEVAQHLDMMRAYAEGDAAALAYAHALMTDRARYPYCADPANSSAVIPLDDASWTQASSPWAVPRDCVWPLATNQTRNCNPFGDWTTHSCLSWQTCGSNYDAFGNPRFVDPKIMRAATFLEGFNWGYTDFDTILSAFLTLFQCLTMEGWVPLAYRMSDAYSAVPAVIFFFSFVVFGSFFLLNLTLGILADQFRESKVQVEQEHTINVRRASTVAVADTKEAPKGRVRAWTKSARRINTQLRLAGASTRVQRSPVARCWARTRASRPARAMVRGCRCLVLNPLFEASVMFLIFVNTAVLAMDSHPMNPSLDTRLENINFGLTLAFACEMVLKLIGLGVPAYYADRFNRFDALIVAATVIEVAVSPPSFTNSNPDSNALSALRLLRLFRLFKLARAWTSLQVLLSTMARTLVDVANFGLLLLLFIYVYALVGMQLFANRMRFDPDTGDPVPMTDPMFLTAEPVTGHFDNLFWACITVFRLAAEEDWPRVMFDARRATGWVSTIYFLTCITLGDLILISLFVAIMLSNFEGKSAEHMGRPVMGPGTLRRTLMRQAANSIRTRLGPVRALALAVGRRNAAPVAPTSRRKAEVEAEAKGEGAAPDPAAAVEEADVNDAHAAAPGTEAEGNPSARSAAGSPPQAAGGHRWALQSPKISPASESQEKRVDSGAVTATHARRDSHSRSILQYGSSRTDGMSAAADSGRDLQLWGSDASLQVHGETKAEEAEGAQRRGEDTGGNAAVEAGGDSGGHGGKAAANGGKGGAAGVPKETGPPPGARRSGHRRDSVRGGNGVDEVPIGTPVPSKPPPPVLEGRSLGLFGPRNPLRRGLAAVVRTPMFDSAILVLIGIASILVAVDNPLRDPNSPLVRVLYVADVVLTTIFAAEMLAKLIVFGLVQGPNAYLRSGWNVLDGLVVSVSVLSLALEGVSAFRALRALRTLRALRPLRVIARYPGLRLVVNTLFRSMPSVMNVLMVCLVLYVIFAIVGISNFKGRFSACAGPVFGNLTAAQEALVVAPVPYTALSAAQKAWAPNASYEAATSKAVCLWLGADWEPVIPQSFDTFFGAMLTLFEMTTTEGWLDIMQAGVDGVGIDMQPKRDNAPGWALFFVGFIVVGSFFMLNLFVGAVVDTYNRMNEEAGGNMLLTETQREWVRIQEVMMRIKPLGRKPINAAGLRGRAVALVSHPRFEWGIMGCILLNTLVMATNHFGEPQRFADTVTGLNYVFAFVFSGEAAVKLFALRSAYFRQGWNIFDFAIVVGTNTGIAVQLATGVSIGTVATAVRTFRVGRILRLVHRAKTLRTMFNTLLLALPGLANIVALLVLLVFIFAVVGVQLFATVQFGGDINGNVNFRSFWLAALFLIRAITGEDWNAVMHDLTARPAGCVDQPAFDPNMCGFTKREGCVPLNGCGSALAVPYMVVFTMIVTFVLLNLFVAIVLDSFSSSTNEEESQLTEGQFRDFVTHWNRFDPDATCFMRATDLPEFFQYLPPPMGFGPDEVASYGDLQRHIASLSLPTYVDRATGEDTVFFTEVALALSHRIMRRVAEKRGDALDLPEDHMVNTKWRRKYDGIKDERAAEANEYTLAQIFAAKTIETTFRAHKFSRLFKGKSGSV